MDKELLEDFVGKDLGELSEEEFDKLMNLQERKFATREKMIDMANRIPSETRRSLLEWTMLFDEDNKKLLHPQTIKIKDLNIKQMKAILRWTDYDYSENDSLALHTINEELKSRR